VLVHRVTLIERKFAKNLRVSKYTNLTCTALPIYSMTLLSNTQHKKLIMIYFIWKQTL